MEIDLRDYLRILWKRIWMIAAIVIITTAASGVFSKFFMEPVYEASTKLIVNKTEDSSVGINQMDLNTVNMNISLINTYKEVIKTPAIMGKVAKEHPEFQMTAGELISKISVSSVNNTQVMTLVVQDPSYQKAANIVNAVSIVFQREISNIMKVDNVSILNEADINENPAPVKPNVVLNTIIAFVVSMMIAVGLAFLIEYFDDTIKTEADVLQYLGMPTLAVISKLKEEDYVSSHSSANKKQVGGSVHVTSQQ